MPTNDFVPVAIGSGSNVPSQAAYLADPLLGSGNLPGVASATFNNKALRQATYGVGALAQYLANITGNDVHDNGDAAYVAILATMAQVFPSRTSAFTPAWVGTTTTPTLGSLALNKGFEQRIADKLHVDVSYNLGTSGTSPTAGSGTILMTLPNSLEMDSAKIGAIGPHPGTISGAAAYPSRLGGGSIIYTTGFPNDFYATMGVYAYSTTQLEFVLEPNPFILATALLGAGGFGNIFSLAFQASIPISGW